MKSIQKQNNRFRRHKRIRAKVHGTAVKPRLFVFRSTKHIYAQLIDDEKGAVLAAASDREIKSNKTDKQTKGEGENKLSGKLKIAHEIGKLLAHKAEAKKISQVVFDRGGYKYHGRVKELADGAREGGLKL